jgi:CPA1 family monovalent cation:H+ antiporter
MSDVTAEYVDKFWELIDEVLNALFVLIDLELLVIHTYQKILFTAVIVLIIKLITRYISIYIPSISAIERKITQKTILILTWTGLIGGISPALSINPAFNKDIWVTITYVIVCFSILVQGIQLVNLLKNTINLAFFMPPKSTMFLKDILKKIK